MRRSDPSRASGSALLEGPERVIVPRLRNPDALLADTLRQIREDLNLPESFPPAVEAEARQVVESVELPVADETAIAFVTIDPEGATDLDQALHLERVLRGPQEPHGYRVRYAIADVPAFVAPGGAIDSEARERGQTLYAPDGRIPLHPTVISEQDRKSVV